MTGAVPRHQATALLLWEKPEIHLLIVELVGQHCGVVRLLFDDFVAVNAEDHEVLGLVVVVVLVGLCRPSVRFGGSPVVNLGHRGGSPSSLRSGGLVFTEKRSGLCPAITVLTVEQLH